MTDTRTPDSHERATGALALLIGAHAAALGLYFISDVLVSLQSQLVAIISREGFRKVLIGLSLVRLIPLALIALGLMRLVAPLVDAGARRWGYTAAGVRGLAVAALLGRQLFFLISETPGSMAPVLATVPTALVTLSKAAVLMAAWAGAKALGLRASRGLLIFAACAVSVDLVADFAMNPSFGPGKELVFENNTLFSLLNEVRGALGLTAEAALLGLFFLLRAALRPTERPELAWSAASRGLALYNWGLRGRIAVALLALAVPWLLSAIMGMYRLGDTLGGVISLASLPCFLMMLAGLGGYALRLEEPRARDHALVALGFILVAASLLLSLSLSAFRGFDAPEMSQPLLGTAVAALFSFVAVLFLLASLYRAAKALHAEDLALTAFQVGRLLLVSVNATLVFQLIGTEFWLVRLLAFVAGVGGLVGGVRFLMLMGRMVERMRQGTAAVPAPGLFGSV